MTEVPGPHTEVATTTTLTAGDRAAVLELARRAAEHDPAYALDDQVLLDLEGDGVDGHAHLLAIMAGDDLLAGYAHLDRRNPRSNSAQLVVDPARRRRGVGSELLARLDELAQPAVEVELRAWAHGDSPAAAALAERLGWTRVRDLWRMRLPRVTSIAQPSYPDGVSVRTFVPGRDESGWVELNADAFADHPEQGRLTLDDVRARERQSWFDSYGFFLAERGDRLLGSHWTKVHLDEEGLPDVGEVYAVGVRPEAQGIGLGKALTLTGLHYLRDRGLDVILYVDADNEAAVATYRGIGFEIETVDVMYARPERSERVRVEASG